ncbi:TPA_asm: hypothetical protein CBHJFHIM_00024 [Methanobrevibacter gottschalkii virus vir075]|uniref:Uncharacterized protein n=1 Tax=Methanobrevibacter gottschalkii TaxID=190974 RepID=A0A1H7IBT8_9EURY|nr:hypothetical protein [Methanobrevibacter gottschalkii]SEK58075.1 hypothetical protein SAMN05216439_1158 [Methanobrevibacter gottschalkii]
MSKKNIIYGNIPRQGKTARQEIEKQITMEDIDNALKESSKQILDRS